MNLTIDIGNSVIGLALVADGEVVEAYSVETRKAEQLDFYLVTFKNLLGDYIKKDIVKGAIIASVVPRLTLMIKEAVTRLFNVTPLIVGPGVKNGLVLKVDYPLEVGADIVACGVGAYKFGSGPFIIIDLGTANKYIYVDDKRVFHGVAISAGLKVAFEGLVRNADQLLFVPFVMPNKVLGKNTKDALASGALNGLLSEMNGFVSLIKEEVGGNPKVLLTGGNALYIHDYIDKSFKYIPHLVHYGLNEILVKNYAK